MTPFPRIINCVYPDNWIYTFLKEKDLFKPEVSFIKGEEQWFYEGDRIPDWDDFYVLFERSDAVTAVAAFDEADRRRINMTYLDGQFISTVYSEDDVEDHIALLDELSEECEPDDDF